MLRFLPLMLLAIACDPIAKTDDTAEAARSVDADGDGYDRGVDCDDQDARIHPGADEVCNGIDDDCDGFVDDEDPNLVGDETYHVDADGDGFGDPGSALEACSPPEGHVLDASDCDDADAAVNPDAEETCDGVDNDCDGDTDEGFDVGTVWYADTDGDGFGDPENSVESCAPPDGYLADDTDCDDGDPAINPDADELCDGVDNDCDGATDDDSAVDMPSWYLDSDADGYGADDSVVSSCEQPIGYTDQGGDCDDADSASHPGAEETCDGVDNDCDGDVDEGIATSSWYADGDADGYGDAGTSVTTCGQPSGHVADDTDCDDADPWTHPGAAEICDEVDNDCDGDVDEGVSTSTWYADADGDGYGDASSSMEACAPGSGWTPDGTDCDDGDSAVNPGAEELCDEVDNDCDGTVDVAATDADTWYADSDGDGYGDATDSVAACDQPTSYVADATDCDDADTSANPAALEICDGVDNDCDGAVDVGAVDESSWYGDADGDGFGDASSSTTACTQPTGYVADATDCDDADAAINPDADETCDGLDEDCDGAVDEDAVDAATWYSDADGDGYGDTTSAVVECTQPSGTIGVGGDCDDGDAAVSPDAEEVCDGVDNDCDGTVDVGASDGDSWYADADGDGFGEVGSSASACDQPKGHVADATDCDDTNAAINPDADERCDGVDNDCDGTVDVGALDVATWYADGDGDGYGDAASTTDSCSQPTGYVAGDTDCDDADAGVHPGADETCDSVDEDCDGDVDEDAVDAGTWYIDADGDGFGDASGGTTECTQPSGTVADGSDCDDTDASINPDAAEWCDGVDTDCDGSADPVDQVSFEDSAGSWSDVSSSFLSTSSTPATYTFSSDGTLYFCPGGYVGFISVSASTAAIVGVDGSGTTELSAGGVGVVIEVASGAVDLSVTGMTLSDGSGTDGGAISSAIVGLTFTGEDLVISDSVATAYGGGIYVLDASSVTLRDASFSGCDADRGGGLYLEEAAVVLSDLDFEGNTAVDRGGGLCIKNSDGTASGFVVSSNSCDNDGGGMFLEGSEIVLTDSTVSDNSSVDRGGGIYLKNKNTDLDMSASLVEGNLAVTGAGMFVDDSTALCTGTSTSTEGFLGNVASSDGGGVYVKGNSGSFVAVSCDLGTGSDDNDPDDAYVDHTGFSYTYGDDADFECDKASCW